MKTNALTTRKTALSFFVGILSLVVTSCGSYQNSSYNDSDGVYNTNGEKRVVKDNQSNGASVQYKQYFSSLQSTGGSNEVFTDVNSYSSDYNTDNDSIQASPTTGYASWGSSPTETHVTVYPDTYWSVGFGWGYPYYGYPYYPYYPYYGWGYPGYGYPIYGWGGYPGYGHYYPHVAHYGYNYNNSRRGSSYGGNYNGGNYNRVTPYASNTISNRNSIYSRNSVTNRTAPTFTNRNSEGYSRNYTQNQSRNSYSQNRNSFNNSSNYQRSSSNYTPSSNNTYRSSSNMSSSNMSSGGGARMSSGGGGGGGRMGGGGRR